MPEWRQWRRHHGAAQFRPSTVGHVAAAATAGQIVEQDGQRAVLG